LVWIDFAKDCEYINIQIHKSLIIRYKEVGKMLGSMADNSERFTPKSGIRSNKYGIYNQ